MIFTSCPGPVSEFLGACTFAVPPVPPWGWELHGQDLTALPQCFLSRLLSLAWASGMQCGPMASSLSVVYGIKYECSPLLPLASPHYTTSCFLTHVAFCALSLLFPAMSYKGQPGRHPH